MYVFLKERILNLLSGGSSDSGPIADLEAQKERAADYGNDEVGLVHPRVHSAIKLKDNGAIDIFIPGHNGIRIDPTRSTVDIFGQIQHHASAVREWIARDSITQAQEAWVVRSQGKVEVEGQTVAVRAAKDVRVESAETLTVAAKGNLAIATEGDLAITAGRNMLIKAGGTIDLE